MTSFETRNETKLKFFEFGAFQNKMHMASREKYMLFRAFHDTPYSMNSHLCRALHLSVADQSPDSAQPHPNS